MDPRVYPGSHTAGNGAHQQLHHLCRKMLEQGVDAKDPHLAPIIEEKVKAKLTTSKLLLNKSQSAHEDATIHEFSVAEKIKKYLVSSTCCIIPRSSIPQINIVTRGLMIKTLNLSLFVLFVGEGR